MDNPLREQIERLVFFPSTTVPSPTAAPTLNSIERRTTRFKVLNSILTSNTPSGASASMSSTSASGPQSNSRSRVLSVQSFETAAYSMVVPPTSPDASLELNGLAQVGLNDPSCKSFTTLGPKSQPAPSGPRRIFSRIFSGLGGSSKDAKGKSRRLYYDADYPLDGEEGELIDDEACFVDASQTQGFDILSVLPYELALTIISYLDFNSVVACLSVSQGWNIFASDPQIWRELFKRNSGWRINTGLAMRRLRSRSQSLALNPSSTASTISRRLSLSFTLPSLTSSTNRRISGVSSHSAALVRPPSTLRSERGSSLQLDWKEIYKNRLELSRRWTTKTFKPEIIVLAAHSDSVYCVELNSTFNLMVTGSRDRTIKFWSLNTGELRHTLTDHHSRSVLCLKCNAWDGFMVSGSSDRSIIVWDLVGLAGGSIGGSIKKVLTGHTSAVLDLRIDGSWIVSCSKDGAVRVWSRYSLEPYCTLSGADGPINAVGLKDDKVVSASGLGKMILWDLKSRTQIRTFEGHERGLACVDFQGDYIISGSNDRKIKVWSVSTGECLLTIPGHDNLVRALSFDAKLKRLVSASYDRSVKVWDFGDLTDVDGKETLTFKCVKEFKHHHTSHIFDVKFDAGTIVSSSHDEKVVILHYGSDLDTSLFI